MLCYFDVHAVINAKSITSGHDDPVCSIICLLEKGQLCCPFTGQGMYNPIF